MSNKARFRNMSSIPSSSHVSFLFAQNPLRNRHSMIARMLLLVRGPEIIRSSSVRHLGMNKHLRSRWSLAVPALCTLLLGAPSHLLAAGQASRITFPASRISLLPAEDYILSGSGKAIENWHLGTWLTIEESSQPVDSTLEKWTAIELLDARDLSLVAKSSGIMIDSARGTKLVFERTAGLLVKRSFYFQAFIVGDSLNSLLVMVGYPDTLRDAFKNALLGMVPTIRWDRAKRLDPMEIIGFTINPRDPLTEKTRKDGSVTYGVASSDSTSHFPVFVVSAISGGEVAITEKLRKETVDALLEGVEPYLHISALVEVNEVVFDGIKGYETVAAGTIVDSAVTAYMVVLFHPAGRVVLFGITGEADLDRNLAAFKETARTFKRRRQSPSDRGHCNQLLSMAQYGEAVKCFDEALREDPTSIPASLGKAEALRLLGRNEEALKLYDSIIADDQRTEEAFLGRARVHVAQGDDHNAVKDFDAALALNADDTDVLVERAEAKSRYGNLPGAQDDFRQAIRRFPGSAKLYKELGDACLLSAPTDSTIAAYDAAIRLDSLDASAYKARGNVLFKNARYPPALRDFQRSLILKPDQIELYRSKAEVELGLGYSDRALKDCDWVLHRNPGDKRILALRGCAHSIMGMPKEALADFAAAIAVDSSFGEAYLWRGVCRLRSEEFKSAVSDFRSALQLNEPSASPLLLFAAEVRAYGEEIAKGQLRKYRNASALRPSTECACMDFALGTITEEQLLQRVDGGQEWNLTPEDRRCEANCALALLHYVAGMKTVASRYFAKCLGIGGYGSPSNLWARLLAAGLNVTTN